VLPQQSPLNLVAKQLRLQLLRNEQGLLELQFMNISAVALN
jgi:hypothetical protein